MPYKTNQGTLQQVHSAFKFSNTTLPQRQRTQQQLESDFNPHVYSGLLVYGTSSTPPSQPAVPPKHATKDRQPSIKSPKPAQYTLDDGKPDVPGTVAYYKSWAFRKKVKAGTAEVPGKNIKRSESIDDSADEDYVAKSGKSDGAKSLVMVFSRTSLRRAKSKRKVNRRMQLANRRM
jgi:hypothetical protein